MKIFIPVLFLLASFQVNASIMVGGYTFDDDAFADSLTDSSGSWTFGGGASSLEDALVGSDMSDFAYSFGDFDYVGLSFDDNVVVNGAGADLVVFEVGTVENFGLAVEVLGAVSVYNGIDTGEDYGGFSLVAAAIDLSDFGFAAGATTDYIELFPAWTGEDPADFTAVGALNSRSVGGGTVSEPSIIALMLAGFAGLSFTRRRKLQA